MLDFRPSQVLEDSRGNKYFFYYKDSSIYYREVSNSGEIKDTILISQVNSDFAGAIDVDDTLYLACNSRYKGIMLFMYTNYGWKFEYVINVYNSSNIYLMDMLVVNGSIHILFSKKLPLPNMYNIYHINKNMNELSPYVEYSWRKNSLSEIYSQNLENSYSLIPTKGGLIHFSGVWHDGTNHYINYYCYDDSVKSWIHKSLSMSYKNNVNVRLLYHNKKLNLFCFSTDIDGNNLHHFINKSSGSSDIEFKHLYSAKVESFGIMPSCFVDEKSIRMEWIKDRIYYQYVYEEASNKWKKAIELPQAADTDILYMKIFKNTGGSVYPAKGYYLIDRNYKISKPMEHMTRNIQSEKSSDKSAEKLVEKDNAGDSLENTEYLKQILNEIKSLSDDVRYLNRRIESLEGTSSIISNVKEESPVRLAPRTGMPKEAPPLKKSSFKERFMKAASPDYKSLMLNQDGISLFESKPSEAAEKPSENIIENKPAADAKATENRAFVEPPVNGGKTADDKADADSTMDYKYNNVFKKIGEFFK